MIYEAKLHHQIFMRWGIPSQYGLLQEECGELIVAINKLFRNKENAHEMICEELADVQNLINQIKLLYPDFEQVRLKKLERVSKLLEAEIANP